MGGLVALALGIALTPFLYVVLDPGEKGVALVGLFPFLIGAAMLFYSYALAPKEP